MPIASIDGQARIISLNDAATESVPNIYSRWVDWANSGNNKGVLPAFSVIADPPTVPVYATLINGWKIRPASGQYTKRFNGGFLRSSDGLDPLAPVLSGDEPRIVYEDPVIAVGYDSGGGLTDQIVTGDITVTQALDIILAAVAGRLQGAQGNRVTIRDIYDTRDAITADVDKYGNRNAVQIRRS